jgi:Tat protein secretion system quality control protein TatD with DNase activity
MTITDTHTHLYSEEFDQDRDEMIQRALSKISRFFIPAIDSSYTQAMYDLERIIRTCFSDDGAASYPCKGELFRGITTCRGRSSENSTPLEKLELIYIGIKPIY